MKRALLLTLLAIFSFTQSTLAIDFNSLWNKLKENQSTVFAAFGGILGITAVIGYKALQKKAIERKKMEEFVQKHPINFMFYLAPGTEYSKLDHKGKMEYLIKNNINRQYLNNKTNFLTDQELNSPFLAREKEQRILSKLTPYSGMENSNTIFDEESQIKLAIEKSLTDQKKPLINKNVPTKLQRRRSLSISTRSIIRRCDAHKKNSRSYSTNFSHFWPRRERRGRDLISLLHFLYKFPEQPQHFQIDNLFNFAMIN